jgi:hypothetical protein
VGKWTTDEDSKLKDAVEKHNGKKWAAVAALVPDRTKVQCMNRWHNALHSKTDDTTARPGKWTKEKDAELKDAVEKHNGKNWAAIAALVPDRTKLQCVNRWNRHNKSDETTGRVGAWATDEDAKLEDAVEKYNGKNWAAISELVPCRTSIQCNKRWHNEKSWYNALHSKSDEMTWVSKLDPSLITITKEEPLAINEAKYLFSISVQCLDSLDRFESLLLANRLSSLAFLFYSFLRW